VSHRLVGIVVSVLAIAATAFPVVLDPVKGDSFPLSTYPMFAMKRATKQSFEYAVALTETGERRRIRPRHVANHEVMQARMTFQHAVRDKTLPALCERIAARVARDPKLADVATIRIVRGTHDALDFLIRDVRGPERTLQECRVKR
jgi:hypothetical protein